MPDGQRAHVGERVGARPRAATRGETGRQRSGSGARTRRSAPRRHVTAARPGAVWMKASAPCSAASISGDRPDRIVLAGQQHEPVEVRALAEPAQAAQDGRAAASRGPTRSAAARCASRRPRRSGAARGVVVDGDHRVRRAGAQRRDEPLDRARVGQDQVRDHAASSLAARDPAAAPPLSPCGRGGAGGRGSRVADPRAPGRGRRGARARLGGASAARDAALGLAARRPASGGGRRRRCAARAPASCTRTTSTRRSAPARWRPREAAGARVVLHLHNYRLVCAVGTCFTRGEDCTRCHGRNTLPGREAQLPRRLARRVRGLRAPGWRSGSGG